MKTRADIKARARVANRERGGEVILAALVFVIFNILESLFAVSDRMSYSFIYRYGMYESARTAALSFPLWIISLFVLMPLYVGYAFFSIRTYRGRACSIGEMYHEAFGQYGRNLGGMLYMVLFISLWSLLLVIPGIIKALSYSMTQYIMGENRLIDGKRALRLSMRITQGRKMDIFVFGLSFIGWIILTGMSLGLLGLYTVPYMNTSFAGLYDELKRDALARGLVAHSDFM